MSLLVSFVVVSFLLLVLGEVTIFRVLRIGAIRL